MSGEYAAHLRRKANDHANVAAEGLMEWNEQLDEKDPDMLLPAAVGLFVIFADIMLAIHYDLQTLITQTQRDE